MKIASLALAPALTLFLSLPAWADKLSLAEISSYINSLKTAQVEFVQTHDDGSQLKGTLFIQRPGRARFEYAPPEKTLVLAGGGEVAIFDGKSNQPPEQYPLSRTPLNLILGNDVDLSKSNMVTQHEGDATATVITAHDPKHPEYGTIQMVFAADPVRLSQWVITDQAGSQTQVVLGQMTLGGEMKPSLFSITREIENRKK